MMIKRKRSLRTSCTVGRIEGELTRIVLAFCVCKWVCVEEEMFSIKVIRLLFILDFTLRKKY